MTSVVLDANVLISVFDQNDPTNFVCLQLINLLRTDLYPIFVPTLIFPEIAASFGRNFGDVNKAERFLEKARKLTFLRPITIDERFAERAAKLAIRNRLRGADAIYAATALQYRALLITNDAEMLNRVDSVTVMSPIEAYAHFSARNDLAGNGSDI